MGKKLVIVESPAKAKTINKILGKDYIVKASMGHIRDLPQKKLGVDIEKDFQPHYTQIKGKQKIIKELQGAAEGVESVYLAPDPDREGEAIAWHLAHILAKQVPEDHFFRVTYNEITAAAIRRAFENPGRLDMKMVNSQQARRVLDRIVGYKVSPLLWRRIRGGSSAGRVQSVALRLVCEREREILDFKKEKYWVIGAVFRKEQEPLDPFKARLTHIGAEKAEIKEGAVADKVVQDLEQASYKVAEIRERQIRKTPRPPYITSTLQQSASGVYGFAPARTMRIAQRLYEGSDLGTGLITYMRTDSVAVSRQAQEDCRQLIHDAYGDEYLPERPPRYKSRSSAQEAHEAIRPTDVSHRPEDLKSRLSEEEFKLYKLIWQRFVASQMAPARINQMTVDIDGAAAGETYRFRVTASQILFPGYMKVTGVEKQKTGNGDGDKEAEQLLPPLTENEPLTCLDIENEEKETQPPPRYSEASLIRTLEENGVGRPSTYANIISTIIDREYVNRIKRSLQPTELGMKVCAFLMSHLDSLFNVKFTAEMEESLDKVEQGSIEWTDMLRNFYGSFEKWIEGAKGPAADVAVTSRLLDLLETVGAWDPPQQRGKRTYSDEKFVQSIRKQLDEGEKAVSQRQCDALVKLVVKYREQLEGWEKLLVESGFKDMIEQSKKTTAPPREETRQKLDALKDVAFDEPTTVGKRTYSDEAFCDSLRQQVEGKKRLSEKQIAYIDKFLLKYAEQLGGREVVLERFKLAEAAPTSEESDESIEKLLELLARVKEWKAPVKRGKRTWDDQGFYDSLNRQFKNKKTLSTRQVASLKRMIQRYAGQIPGYEREAPALGLPTGDDLKRKGRKA